MLLLSQLVSLTNYKLKKKNKNKRLHLFFLIREKAAPSIAHHIYQIADTELMHVSIKGSFLTMIEWDKLFTVKFLLWGFACIMVLTPLIYGRCWAVLSSRRRVWLDIWTGSCKPLAANLQVGHHGCTS